MVKLGVVGKPNVGKSTFFTAATLAAVEIADYPFTTIDFNRGVGFVQFECPHVALEIQCTPGNAGCHDGIRQIPVELIDVAGLVPGASEGKGRGNEFLDHLRQAQALIHVVDGAGATDAEGNPIGAGQHDPVGDLSFLEDEIVAWIVNILSRGWERLSRKFDMEGKKHNLVISDQLSGLGANANNVEAVLRTIEMPEKMGDWSEQDIFTLARSLRKALLPIVVAANKMDRAPEGNLERMKEATEDPVIPTLAEGELALRRAGKAGMINYLSGEDDFSTADGANLNAAQEKALDQIRQAMKPLGGTGVSACLNKCVFELLDYIPVFPVEDEGKYMDKQGRILPDVFLVPRGTTARGVAYAVHSDIGEGFIRAIDARTKRVIGADHEVGAGDIIKIVAKS